uniref:Serine-aspartate repeat-containing protein C n=1 Tax=Zeugodacus cucurbitae TaxID=28588 RepID=A0A0A1WWT6_ZEUCU
MTARKVILHLRSAIFFLYYIEYVAAQPTGVHIFHSLTHGFNSPQVQQSPDSISIGGMNGGYMAVHAELHPWQRHRHHNGHANHKHFNFVLGQPNFHDSGEFNTNNVGNAPPYILNHAAGPLEVPSVNVALTENTIMPHHPWHNPHSGRHHHRWHFGHRGRILDLDFHGGYEAGGFGQTAIFGTDERENTEPQRTTGEEGIGEQESSIPQRTSGDEQLAEGATDITTSTTPQAVISTTTETTEGTVEITEPTTKSYETTEVNDSVANQTSDATVTTEPTESTFAIDIRGEFA